MNIKSKFLFILPLIFLYFQAEAIIELKQYNQKPKLIIVLVVDQLRSDFLTRFSSKFLPAQNNATVGGYNFLMQNGAYFPFAEYNVAQSMTCPGHAMIATGAIPADNGILLNEWYDKKEQKLVYCTDDAQFGISPKLLRGTTFSDEIKMAGFSSKVYSIGLKDRSTVMMGGKNPNASIWFNWKTHNWSTSAYYLKQLPEWIESINKKLTQEKDNEYVWKTDKFEKRDKKNSKAGIMGPYGTDLVFQFATQIIKEENLGKNQKTDILSIALSNHDILGHAFGPISPESEALTIYEDKKISELLNYLKRHLGSLDQILFVLTADHGAPPVSEVTKENKIESDRIDYLNLYKSVNESLDGAFGKIGKESWFEGGRYLHFFLNQKILNSKKLNKHDVENVARASMESLPGVLRVFTSGDYEKNNFPAGELGEQIKRQYVYGKSGDLFLILKPYHIEKDENNTTHLTGYSYDRQVPLILFGKNIVSGVYEQGAQILDLASTLTFIMGAHSPAMSYGKPLNIFRKK